MKIATIPASSMLTDDEKYLEYMKELLDNDDTDTDDDDDDGVEIMFEHAFFSISKFKFDDEKKEDAMNVEEDLLNPAGFLRFIHPTNTGFENTLQLRCYKQLQKYCDSPNPNNFGCARAAVIMYDQNNIPLNHDILVKFSVQVFFADVIFPNISYSDIISPKDFCNIGGHRVSQSSVTGQSQLTDDQLYLINMKELLNSPDKIKKCKVDLYDLNTIHDALGVKTLFYRAFFTKTMLHYLDPDSFGIKYLKYISNTINDVEVVNSDTDTPLKYCKRFNYLNGTRATE